MFWACFVFCGFVGLCFFGLTWVCERAEGRVVGLWACGLQTPSASLHLPTPPKYHIHAARMQVQWRNDKAGFKKRVRQVVRKSQEDL